MIKRKYPIVCISGSMRFINEIIETENELTLSGNIVLSRKIPKGVYSEEQEMMLKNLHREEIMLCSTLYVVNVDGYIDDSVKEEIEFAKYLGKEIIYLGEPDSHTDDTVKIETVDIGECLEMNGTKYEILGVIK